MSNSDFSPVAGWGFRAAALALAALLLGTQILAALEYTDGAAQYVRVSAVSVMVALAVLPCAFEYAKRVGSWPLALSVVLIGTAFLAYSLPATLSRAADLRERAAETSAEYGQAEEDLKTANALLNQCLGVRKNCDAAERNVQRIEKTKEKASSQLNATGADTGVEILAYWTKVDPEAVRRGGVLAFGVGVELAIAVLMALACRAPRAPRAPRVPRAPEVRSREIEEIEPDDPPASRRNPANTASQWINGYMDGRTDPVSLSEAYATYAAERKGKRIAGVEKFTTVFQKEAKRRGLVMRTEGRRRLYAVA